MVASTSDGGTTSDGSDSGMGVGSIVDFLTTKVGMALAAGFVIALVAGYFII